MNETDSATRAFVAKHAVALCSYFGRAASGLSEQQVRDWARLAGLTIESGDERAPGDVAEPQTPLWPLVNLAALEARIRHEVVVKVFDRNRDGELELLPTFLGEVETYLIGRVQRVERGRPLVGPGPSLPYRGRSREQQAILRRLATDTAHAFLAIRYPLDVAIVDGFRLLERVDAEIAFWF